jgi:N-acetylmuramic acid 6-phosphate (MurNAc-6-P) etherase
MNGESPYVYGGNSPIRFADPDGREPEPASPLNALVDVAWNLVPGAAAVVGPSRLKDKLVERVAHNVLSAVAVTSAPVVTADDSVILRSAELAEMERTHKRDTALLVAMPYLLTAALAKGA